MGKEVHVMYQFKNGSQEGFVVAYKKPYDESISLAEFSHLSRAASFADEARHQFGGRYKIFAVTAGRKEEIWDSEGKPWH